MFSEALRGLHIMSYWLRWCHILVLKPNIGKIDGVTIRLINTHSGGSEASPAARGHLKNDHKKRKLGFG